MKMQHKKILSQGIRSIIAAILILTILVPVYTGPVYAQEEAAADASIQILYEGDIVDTVTVDEGSYKVLTLSRTDVSPIQWQILVPGESPVWVDIAQKTESNLTVDYALVQSLLDKDNMAQLRCRVGEGQEVRYSEQVKIIIAHQLPSIEEAISADNIDKLHADPAISPEQAGSGYRPEEPVDASNDGEALAGDTTTALEDVESLTNRSVEPSISEEAAQGSSETMNEEATSSSITPPDTPEIQEAKEESQDLLASLVSLDDQSMPLAFVNPMMSLMAITPDNGEAGEVATTEAAADSEAASSEESQERKITISYYYADNRQDRLIATTEAAIDETGHAEKIIPPNITGYSPYYNPENLTEEDASQATEQIISSFSLDNLSDGDEVYVYYKPVAVSYRIKYFFQNLQDDEYTEDAKLEVVSSAPAGTILGDSDLSIEKVHPDEVEKTVGFTMIANIPQAVSNDGTSVYYVFYNRNYYLLKFDIDGGYGVDPIYAKYRTTITVPAPQKAGYNFLRWRETDEAGVPKSPEVNNVVSLMPAENKWYQAVWEKKVNVPYTVVYWWKNTTLGGKDPDSYSAIGSVTKTAPSGTPIEVANSTSASDEQTGLSNSKVIVKNDLLMQEPRIRANMEWNHVDTLNSGDNYLYNLDMTKAANTNQVVKGDGTTVVNIYYDRRVYTLRFFYARKEANKYYVCGNTPSFGYKDLSYKPVTYNLHNLMMGPKNAWGEVQALPTLNAEGQSLVDEGKWQTGEIVSGAQTFYYIEISAPYGEDISDIWPQPIYFEPTPIVGTHSSVGGDTKAAWRQYAYCAGWTGEFKTAYTRLNSNTTIKSLYNILDDNLLYWDGQSNYQVPDNLKEFYKYDTSSQPAINFLAFFANGANLNWNKVAKLEYKLYTENLPDSTGQTSYSLAKTIYAYDNNANPINQQTAVTLEGFTNITDKNRMLSGTLKVNEDIVQTTYEFYYKRNQYKLKLYNIALPAGNTSGYQEMTVPFEKDLGDVIPDSSAINMPSSYEKGAYRFAGWYYTANYEPGTEVHLDSDTMPAKDVSIFAKWELIKHEVKFFATSEAMYTYQRTGDEGLVYQTQANVTHGTSIGSGKIQPPVREDMKMIGWFYIRNGKKVSFDPASSQVNSDLKVFAEWQSDKIAPYIAFYTLAERESDDGWLEALDTLSNGSPRIYQSFTVQLNGQTREYLYLGQTNGYHRKVAADTTGYAPVGSNKTFDAKAGAQENSLYPAFQTGYFPLADSNRNEKVIEIQDELDLNNLQKNVVVFQYVPASQIGYTVEYRHSGTGELLTSANGGSIQRTSDKNMVVEQFVPINGMVVDEPYKRIILYATAVPNPDGGFSYVSSRFNKETFYYTPTQTSAGGATNQPSSRYVIHYLFQKISSNEQETSTTLVPENYIEDIQQYSDNLATANSTANFVPQQFAGFEIKTIQYAVDNGLVRSLSSFDSDYPEQSLSVQVGNSNTDIYIYYTRKTMAYKVYYLRAGTSVANLSSLVYQPDDPDHSNGVLAQIKYVHELDGRTVINRNNENNLPGPNERPYHIHFGDTVTEPYLPIAGYKPIENNAQKSLVLTSDNRNNNLFIFYEPLKFTSYYRVKGHGKVSLGSETVVGTAFRGAQPIADPGYSFAGWFLNEAGTQPVIQGNQPISGKNTLAEIEASTYKLKPLLESFDANNPVPKTFYAKFVPTVGSIEIRRSAKEDMSNGNEIFVYRVTKTSSTGLSIEPQIVTVKKGSSVVLSNLPVGTYRIEQLNNWSWRYRDRAKDSITVTKNAVTVVTFDGDAQTTTEKSYSEKWLNSNSDASIVKRQVRTTS